MGSRCGWTPARSQLWSCVLWARGSQFRGSWDFHGSSACRGRLFLICAKPPCVLKMALGHQQVSAYLGLPLRPIVHLATSAVGDPCSYGAGRDKGHRARRTFEAASYLWQTAPPSVKYWGIAFQHANSPSRPKSHLLQCWKHIAQTIEKCIDCVHLEQSGLEELGEPPSTQTL